MSVVIPCYCSAATLKRAVESVVGQTLKPKEIVVVDDGSPDGGATRQAIRRIRELADDAIEFTVLLFDQNLGPAHARNAGWASATQPYIAFLDADDVWHPRKLEVQIDWMERHPDVALSGTRTMVIRDVEEIPQIPLSWSVRELGLWHVLLSNPLPTRSVVVRKNVPHRFLAEKRYSEDYLLWTTMVADGLRAVLLDVALAFAFKPDFGIGGLSAHLWRMHVEVRDCYRRLYADGRITAITRFILDFVSWLKFSRRLMLTAWWRVVG